MRYPTPDKMCYFTGAGKNTEAEGGGEIEERDGERDEVGREREV